MINFIGSALRFFKRRLLIGHISRIPVRIDYRWFAVFALLIWLVSDNIPPTYITLVSVRLFVGLSTVTIFFATLFLHELAHAYAARREGINVIEIVLHPFGGVARLTREPDTPGAEFRIAIAGPAASFVVTLVFLALYSASVSLGTNILSPIFFILFLLNLMLAVFNLFPGFPLDGGRVLRAVLWRGGMKFEDATVLTGKFGQIISLALVFFGVAIVGLSRDIFTGIWSIVVGIFLFDSATGFIRRARNVDNLIVENVMEMPVTVSPDDTVMECVDKILPYYRQTVYPAAEDQQLYGFFVLKDVKKKIPRKQWRETLVRDVMRPVAEEYFVEAHQPLNEAHDLLRSNGLGVLGVIDSDGKLVGFLQRGRIRKRS